MKIHEGMFIGISRVNSEESVIDLECVIECIKDNVANVYVYNGDWNGLLNLDTMDMEVLVPSHLRFNKEENTYDPNPIMKCKFVPFWTYKDGRCTICGAKEETHEEDHLCRLHKLDLSYLNTKCCVCNGKKTGDVFEHEEDWDDDIPF